MAQQEFKAPTKVEPGVVQTPAPRPQDEAAAGKTQMTREMEMGVTVRKGEPVQIHKFIREDR
jgi:hypothetical protein